MDTKPELNITIDMISAPTMVFRVKPGPRFSWWKMNRAAEQFLGFAIKDFVTPDLDKSVGLNSIRSRHRKELNDVCLRCFTTKTPINYDLKHQRPDGSYRWSRSLMVPIFSNQETIQYIMVTTTDITELIKTQAHLEEALTITLSGFVIICAACKKIHHNDEWQPIEKYASEQMDFNQFSHSMCPPCQHDYYGDHIPDM